MKTLFTIALAGFVSLSSFANENNDDLNTLSAVKANFKTINVLLKEEVGAAKIAILDESGKKLHQRKVKDAPNDLVIPYDMNELPVGEYQVEITTEDDHVVYTVNTFDRAIPAEQLPLNAHAKIVDRNTVSLAVFGLIESGVDVAIKHEGTNKTLYSEKIETPEAFRKNFKFERVDAEDVYFVVTDVLGRNKVIHI